MTVHGKSYTTQLTPRLAIASSRTKRKCRSMPLKKNMIRLALLSFVSACRKVTAVCLRLQAFGRKRSRSEASCCSHEKPGLETGKPKLAATRYGPVKKASRGTVLLRLFSWLCGSRAKCIRSWELPQKFGILWEKRNGKCHVPESWQIHWESVLTAEM